MPTQFLSTAERRRLMDWPATVAEADLATYYTLDAADLEHIGERRGAGNRLGVALQLGALRHLGFVPDNLQHAPPAVLASLAPQLQVPVTAIADYADRAQTRTDHLTAVARHLGYRLPGEVDLAALADWLVERALEHEQPTLLLHLTTQHLRAQRLVRPGITVLERLVAAARERAEAEIFHRVDPLLVPARRAALDALLVTDAGIRGTRLGLAAGRGDGADPHRDPGGDRQTHLPAWYGGRPLGARRAQPESPQAVGAARPVLHQPGVAAHAGHPALSGPAGVLRRQRRGAHRRDRGPV